MTEQVESAQNLSQPQAGQPGKVEGGGVQPSSPAVSEIAALKESFATLQNELRGLQSKQDKGEARTLNTLSDMQEIISRYASLTGQQVDPNAVRNMRIDALLEGSMPTSAQPASPQPATTGAGQASQQPAAEQVNFAESVRLAGLEPTEAVYALVAQYGHSQAALDAALMAHKRQLQARGNLQQSAGVGAVQPTGSQPPPPQTDQQVLMQQYELAKKGIKRGSPQMAMLRREYRTKGLRI